ncbi:cilia- and flagella-associated protein 65 [Discoglossus pictus]
MGVEVGTTICWQKWEPGKEVCKNLTLKNVRMRIQKIKFSPPRTPYFSTLFPQTITLSPGTSFSLPITFRPLEKCDYDDSITFETEEGKFSVALHAPLPRTALMFPEALELPTCAAFHKSDGSFVMCNVSDLQTPFKWEVQDTFLLSPANGILEPRSEIRIKVLFQPKIALAHVVTATCRFGLNDEYERKIRLSGIAKYPHLLVSVPGEADGVPGDSQKVLQFGTVGVGMVVEKHIELLNLSVVDCPFLFKHNKQAAQIDCDFHCSVVRGVVPAQGKLRIPLQFRPKIAGMESVDYFHAIPAGNLTKTVLKVSGRCQGPSMSLLNPILNFGLVNMGEQILRKLEINNSSDVPAHYQFDIDSSESVFSFDVLCGTLGPRETKNVHVIFTPCHPIPYYRRVSCLIHHQEPLFLDLIGTCHSDTDKPALLLPKHLPLYRTNMARGLTFYPPDILYSMLQENKLGTDQDGALMLLVQDIDGNPPDTFTNQDPISEYFDDDLSSGSSRFPAHITASTRNFDFGCCSGRTVPLAFSLTNRTKGRVTIAWTCKPLSPFRVTPECIEIPPLKSTAFRVAFQPPQPNSLYSGELEGFIFYKVLRDYRNVEDVTLCPPWCITLRAKGHTFEPGHKHFFPSYLLDSPQAIFPPVKENYHTQVTLRLQNTGSLVLTYQMDQETCPSIQVKPASGSVTPGSHQILLLRTTPSDTSLSRHCLPLKLNYSTEYTKEIVLLSRAERPQLLLENDAKLFFKPTCVGTQTMLSYTLQNCSRIPLYFDWKIQQLDRPFISVTPTSGVINPNDTMAYTFSFVPQEDKAYSVKTSVLAWPAEEGIPSVKKSRYILRIFGQGCTGTISTVQEQMDMGNILVGGFQSCDLLLSNNGHCSLDYTLSVEQEISGPCDPEEVCNLPLALEIENNRGSLPGRTKVNIRITARPARRLQYIWRIHYCILTPKAVDPEKRVSKEHFLCCVTAQGVYPTLSVTDACPAGSATAFNRMQLWRLFSLERLNAYLQRDPTPGELIYRVPTRHSTRRCPPVNTPVLIDFNFGAAPVGSEPFVALLLLQNNGVLPVNWDFLLPADQQIELEFWAETWEFDQSEIHQMQIQDNKLFAISPKSGILNPGQQQTVKLLYRHDFIGSDRLPVLLKVSHGREILINFIGVTVEKEQRYVHFTSTKHQFIPVAIGSSSPSKQIYELYNGGSVAVIYEIQLDPLRKIQEQNYHHPIFQCLNPKGEILPGATAFVEWIFSPLEAKSYSVDVPINILGGDSALVTFEGIGYDRNVLGDTAVFESYSSLAETQKLTLHGQVANLSKQRVSFGDFPVLSKSSRLLFLNNTSKSETIFFTWYAGTPNASKILQVSPLSGVVPPGEGTHVIVTLQADDQATFYSMDLVCEVFMENSLTKYEHERQNWEEEEERQSVEFTIKERASPLKSGYHAECSKKSGGSGGSVKANQKELRRYKTLPPIKSSDAPHPPASRDQESRRAEKEAQRIWTKPEPPTPLQLHLSVTGRSHHISDYMNHFPSDFQKHFMMRLLNETVEKPAQVDLQPETGEAEKLPENHTLEQQELTIDIMATIIRNLLDDQHFHEALEQVQNEPPPYFFQLGSGKKPKTTTGIPRVTELSSTEQNHLEAPATIEEEKEKAEEMTGSMISSVDMVRDEIEGNQQLSSDDEQDTDTMEKIQRSPTFACLVESILENTLQNIMIEANRGEVVLTTRPRVIALPPTTARGTSSGSTIRTLSADRM